MKKGEIRMIGIIIIIGIVIIVGMLVMIGKKHKGEEKNVEENNMEEKYVSILEDGTKLNISEKMKQVRKIEGIEIRDIQLTNQDGVTVILGTVTNTTNSDKGITPVKITLYNDKGNKIEEIEGIIPSVKAGESEQMNIGTSVDYSNAYDLKIEVMR